MTSYLDQVKAEAQAIIDAKGEDGATSIPIYDPTAFDYRPVGGEKVVGCLDGCIAWRSGTPGATSEGMVSGRA